MKDRISVLVVDDSALMRNLVSKIFDDAPDIEVVATARNGIVALQRIEKFQPDIIILDIEMPEMNGLEFLRERNKRGIHTPVIVLSSLAQRGARVTMEALALGASDFIPKPSGPVSQDIHKTKDQLIQFVRIYTTKRRLDAAKTSRDAVSRDLEMPRSGRKTVSNLRDRVEATKKKRPARRSGHYGVIAIGISTGGPNALREVFPHVKAGLPPVLVVQHMPKGFTGEFAKSLNEICPLSVKEAKSGDLIESGRVLIAPGDQHMEIEKKRLANVVRLTQDPPVNGHRPSVDVLFSSVAAAYGGNALAIIMTGMGKDGAAQIGNIHKQGGVTIAQDETTSVVFGMPKAAIENGSIHHVVPLPEIAGTINTLCAKNDG